MAVIVPMVSKKSASIRVKTSRNRRHDAGLLEGAEEVELTERAKLGCR
jgi:hypothetical protein